MAHYFFSGDAVNCTEEWNGTSWTEVNDIDSSTGYGGTTEADTGWVEDIHRCSNRRMERNKLVRSPDVNAGSAGRRSDAGGCSPVKFI